VPALKSWKELGIPLKEAPPGTRFAMGGKIPETMKGPEWLKKMDRHANTRGTVDEVLGKTRAKLWREGKVSAREMVNQNNRVLNLDELYRKEGLGPYPPTAG
jgi:hypothetical protein